MSIRSLFGLVSQKSLASRRFEFEDRPLERAALFPLFDEEGQTRIMMITAEESGRILLADWSPDLFARRWPWRNRLHRRMTDLSDASAWDEERFEDLWHFDPWWVLNAERYQGHSAVPGIRRTNIPGFDETLSDVYFHQDLGRVSYVVTGSGESVRAKRFTADTLAAAARRREAQARPRSPVIAGWRLRPFWHFS